MGVRKLNKFIKENYLIKEYHNLSRFININKRHNNKLSCIILAIDFWLYAHKFAYSYNNMLVGFWNQIIKLLSHRVIPLYVFDGISPVEKEKVIQSRNKKKKNLINRLSKLNEELSELQNNILYTPEKIKRMEVLEEEQKRLSKTIINITKNDIELVKKLFNIFNIPIIYAKNEADAMCAKLYDEGYITACMTDDMDMLPLGCGKTIKFEDNKLIEYDLNYILNGLKISYRQFVEMCIIFGCDYLQIYTKIDCFEIYHLIKNYKSIDNILNNANHHLLNNNNDKCKLLIDNYQSVVNIFINSPNEEEIPVTLIPSIETEIDPSEAIDFLNLHCKDFLDTRNIDKITMSIEYINNHIVNKFLYNSKHKFSANN
jgi:5'-3' exonuclease